MIRELYTRNVDETRKRLGGNLKIRVIAISIRHGLGNYDFPVQRRVERE